MASGLLHRRVLPPLDHVVSVAAQGGRIYTREVLDQGRLLLLQGSGLLTGDEPVATTHTRVEDGACVSKVDTCLALLYQVTRLDFGAEHLMRVVDLDRQRLRFIPRAVVALVAPRDEVFGMARMGEMRMASTNWTTEVFRSRKKPEEWIAAHRKGGR